MYFSDAFVIFILKGNLLTYLLKYFIQFERPYMISYLTLIDNIRLTRFRDIRHQRFKGLTLTFDPWSSSGVENVSFSRRPYMISYLTSTDNISLSRTVFEIFDFKVFRV